MVGGLAVFGDSILAARAGLPAVAGTLGWPGPVVSYARSGARVDEQAVWIAHLPSWVSTAYVQLGINDLGAGASGPWVYWRLTVLVERLVRRGLRVVVGVPLPAGRWWDGRRMASVRWAYDVLRDLMRTRGFAGAVVTDQVRAAVDDGFRQLRLDLDSGDGLHPNARGRARAREAIRGVLGLTFGWNELWLGLLAILLRWWRSWWGLA